MSVIIWSSLLAFAVLCPFCVQAKPMGGKFNDVILSYNASEDWKISGSCHMMGLYTGSTISIEGKLSKNSPKDVKLGIVAKLFKLRCANLLQMEDELFSNNQVKPCDKNPSMEEELVGDYVELKYIVIINRTLSEKTEEYKFEPSSAAPATVTTPPPPPANSTMGVQSDPPVLQPDTIKPKTPDATATEKVGKQKRAALPAAKPIPATAATMGSDVTMMTVGNDSRSGVYLLQVFVERLGDPKDNITVEVTVATKMRNPHGYLSAIDYPGLVFYGLMTSVYAIYAIAWIIMMLCSFNDLVRLQFWVLAVIILGFLEKTFFVAEYSAINLGSDTYGSYVIAEFVSAVKRGISRMLLIIVAMGFGTVKPRLGDSLFKVVAAGVAYFVLALIDGVMRARTDTFHTSDTSSMVTLVLLLLLDTFIFYWIFTSIVDTRRTLRLRKNYVKLAMYNHFAYTLIFAIIATIGFIIWVFVALEYPSGMCLTDWREVWLRDCFWHVLFAFILLVVMVIWRPSSNRSRFAYSLVTDADDDEVVFEQGNNKNFDTIKMRSVSKPGSTSDPPPPQVTSQAEDDLKWVEENLPTTAMDKALPLLLDSDEEVMTTKFEVSKMN